MPKTIDRFQFEHGNLYARQNYVAAFIPRRVSVNRFKLLLRFEYSDMFLEVFMMTTHDHDLKKLKLQEKKLRSQKKRLMNELSIYRKVLESIRYNQSFEDVLRSVIDLAINGLGFDRAGIILLTEQGDAIEHVIGVDTQGRYEFSDKGFPCISKKSARWFSDLIHGYAQWGCGHENKKHVHEELGDQDLREKSFCSAQLPIKVDYFKTIGVLAADNLFTQRQIDRRDMQNLVHFAAQVGLAIESFRLYEKVTALTITDPLTGLHNRRYFEETLKIEFKRSVRHGLSMGLLYGDLDHFKAINDRWGHPVGDDVLRRVASTLRSSLRNIDIIARIGGEEFAFILPDTAMDKTRLIGDRLVQEVAFSHDSPQSVPITISLGAACFPETSEDLHELTLAADKSLYEAKNLGRNQLGPIHLRETTTL